MDSCLQETNKNPGNCLTQMAITKTSTSLPVVDKRYKILDNKCILQCKSMHVFLEVSSIVSSGTNSQEIVHSFAIL